MLILRMANVLDNDVIACTSNMCEPKAYAWDSFKLFFLILYDVTERYYTYHVIPGTEATPTSVQISKKLPLKDKEIVEAVLF